MQDSQGVDTAGSVPDSYRLEDWYQPFLVMEELDVEEFDD